ncbi:MAG: GreA/GreB family elongation factor [Steroidobacteraceae bacterium]
MDSPLGRALLRRGLDDELTVEVPGGSRTLTVVEIDYDIDYDAPTRPRARS